MVKTILLKLAGPLQSWGTQSHFETRQTDFHPSKSAIIGLISASFGYKRDDDEKIQELNELKFAVRIDQQGALLRDYHTVRKYKPNGSLDRTYVTERYYLEDAVFLVGISHDDENFLNNIFSRLKEPYYQQFMGRRSLPVTVDFLLGIFDGDIINCIQNYPRINSSRRKGHSKDLLTIYADADLLDSKSVVMRKDRVESFSQKNRKFKFRSEVRLEMRVDSAENNLEHDAFGAVGE